MAWELVETAAIADGELTLYRQGDIYMIRANGYELMNGFGHQSELALGHLAVAVAEVSDPHILIGGLGLGYTLAAVAEALAGSGQITVVEFSPQVIGWFDRYVSASVLPQRPAQLDLVCSDIGAFLRRDDVGPFDVIALDVDNGPEALVSPANAVLYSGKGLRDMAAKLRPDGTILIWSAFDATDFVMRADEAGFDVEVKTLAAVRRPDLLHYAYVLKMRR